MTNCSGRPPEATATRPDEGTAETVVPVTLYEIAVTSLIETAKPVSSETSALNTFMEGTPAV